MAWPDPLLVSGALEGDFLKGRIPNDLPRNLAIGVQLHRHIDAFTDSHELIFQLKSEFKGPLRRYAGILIDLCFDHYLSKNWGKFHSLPITVFSQEIIAQLEQNQSLLSSRAHEMYIFLKRYKILESYIEWDNVLNSAYRTGKRFKLGNPFIDIERTLSPLDSRIEEAFMIFYPKLIRQSSHFLLQQKYTKSH